MSRGFGYEVSQRILESGGEVLGVSRKDPGHLSRFVSLDLTDSSGLELKQNLQEFSPNALYYCAGGGPFGQYGQHKFSSHEWAFRLNFLTPSWILHQALQGGFPHLQQLIFVGSAVAESQIEPCSPSYGAAKTAMAALVKNIQAQDSLDLDVRLFSPGYMDTEMLPPNSWPRKEGLPLLDPQALSHKFVEWANDSTQKSTHLKEFS